LAIVDAGKRHALDIELKDSSKVEHIENATAQYFE